MRDMWPMTGGCHYASGCERYVTGCGKCKQLNSKRNLDLSKLIYLRKEKSISSNVNFVSISNWLAIEGKKSKLLKNYNIQVIPNGIDVDDFFPVNKSLAKEILNIRTKKRILLIGAQNLMDDNKGLNFFIEALKEIDENKYFIIFFGKLSTDYIKNLKHEHKIFGFLNDTISLRLIYSASDVFIAPSLQEAFGKTIAEAMACETPVVCFDSTGPKDIVNHKHDGYKAKAFDSSDLARGINWICANKNYREIQKNSRRTIEEKFNIKFIAKQYFNLYNSILTNK